MNAIVAMTRQLTPHPAAVRKVIAALTKPTRVSKSRSKYPERNRRNGRERLCKACGQWKAWTQFNGTGGYRCLACQTAGREPGSYAYPVNALPALKEHMEKRA